MRLLSEGSLSIHGRVSYSGKIRWFYNHLLYSKYQNHDLIREIGKKPKRAIGNILLLSGFPCRVGGRCKNIQRTGDVPPTLLRLYLQRKTTILQVSSVDCILSTLAVSFFTTQKQRISALINPNLYKNTIIT